MPASRRVPVLCYLLQVSAVIVALLATPQDWMEAYSFGTCLWDLVAVEIVHATLDLIFILYSPYAIAVVMITTTSTLAVLFAKVVVAGATGSGGEDRGAEEGPDEARHNGAYDAYGLYFIVFAATWLDALSLFLGQGAILSWSFASRTSNVDHSAVFAAIPHTNPIQARGTGGEQSRPLLPPAIRTERDSRSDSWTNIGTPPSVTKARNVEELTLALDMEDEVDRRGRQRGLSAPRPPSPHGDTAVACALLVAERDSSDWKYVKTDKEVEIYRKEECHTASMGVGDVVATPGDVVNVLIDADDYAAWDYLVDSSHTIKRLDEASQVIYCRYFLPEGRVDFVFTQTVEESADGGYTVAVSPASPLLAPPPPDGTVRGTIDAGGYIVTPQVRRNSTPGTPVCKVEFVTMMNIKGVGPSMVESLALRQPLVIAALRRHLRTASWTVV